MVDTVSSSTEISPRNTPLRYIKGIGPKRAVALERLGIHSIRDLFYYFPRRYEDRSHFISIADLQPGQIATIRGEVLAVRLKPIRGISIFELVVGDSTGMVHAVWFNQPYLKNQFAVGQHLILYGKTEWYKERLQISSPEYELMDEKEESLHAGRITPIYPLTEGLFQRSIRSTMKELIDTQLDKHIFEYLPESFRSEKKLMELREAIHEMHFPVSFEKQGEARKRIVFDEFFMLELLLFQKMERMKLKHHAHSFQKVKACADQFRASLPFKLTTGQEQALLDVCQNLESSVPMNRLLQGDVGSGKTVIAAFALLLAAQNGYQGAFLVPTEILAEQHFRTLKKFLAPFPITLGLLTASTPTNAREKMLVELKKNKLSILVGTHAMLQDDVIFEKLALLITDEQHKFGVYQRCQLLNREPRPHQLVMTATPIPRTLGLTVYGDLDISLMKELPAGRQPIKTFWITRKKQKEVLEHILKKIKEGEQAYFIFPLIEETEKSDMLAATKEYENLKKHFFSQVPMGLVHGRMDKSERDTMMNAFRREEIKILVATSVIEVGVDHPNATMMVIENAERFGLSQLHQMRGRIGRGSKPSECFLFGEPKTEEGSRRLRILTKTQDGFMIAEEDLKLRGPGDFMGTRQSGEPFFKVANPILDEEILVEARRIAMYLVKQRKLESLPEWRELKIFLEQNPIHY